MDILLFFNRELCEYSSFQSSVRKSGLKIGSFRLPATFCRQSKNLKNSNNEKIFCYCSYRRFYDIL